MTQQSVLECSFFIPLKRDGHLSDGAKHEEDAWQWLRNELYVRFSGITTAPGIYQGVYVDPDTRDQVSDESFRFIVAIDELQIDSLRLLLRAACIMFAQKCIYLSVAGRVEFIGPPEVSSP
jgi:hypothetical protein